MGVIQMLSRLGVTQHRRHYTRIATLLQDRPIEHTVQVKGWVKGVRKQKERTFIDVDDGSSVKKLQVVIPSELRPPGLGYHCVVKAQGVLRPSIHPAQRVELMVDHIQVLSSVDGRVYPFKARQKHSLEYLRLYPHLRTRTSTFAAIMRVRAQAKQSIQQYFDSEGFICIDTPVLTTNDCEGGGEVFSVEGKQDKKSSSGDTYFPSPAHLTVSGQLHLEAAASCLSKVYCLNPAFRAENSQTRRHLSEFWMLEAEEAFMEGEEGLEGVVGRVEECVKECVKGVMEKREEEVWLCWRTGEERKGRETSIQHLLSDPFIRMTYTEALDILTQHAPALPCPPPVLGHDLRREYETFLTSHTGGRPVVVTHWPRETKAFYVATLHSDPSVALAMDLLLPHVGEVAGGGVREASPTTLRHNLPHHTQQALEWYIEMRRGAPPTAGFGLGFERLLQFVLGLGNVKDAIPFPRWAGHCLC